jgi:predicted transcriptional regulator
MQIAELEQALLSSHPSLPTLLQQIHRAIKQDPDAVTLLSEEEIGVIVNGLSRQTQTAIAVSISSGKKGKSIKSIGVDDL